MLHRLSYLRVAPGGGRKSRVISSLLTTPYRLPKSLLTLSEISSSTPTPPHKTRSSISPDQETNPAQDPRWVVAAPALAGVVVLEEEEGLDGGLDVWMMFEGRSVGAVVKCGV